MDTGNFSVCEIPNKFDKNNGNLRPICVLDRISKIKNKSDYNFYLLFKIIVVIMKFSFINNLKFYHNFNFRSYTLIFVIFEN